MTNNADTPKSWKEHWSEISEAPGGGQADTKLVRRKGSDDPTTYFLKILRKQNESERRARMYREISAYRTLQHPAIPRLIDTNSYRYDDLNYKLYLVTEYISGMTLKDFMKRSGPLDLKDSIELVIRLLTIVEHCHKNEIVHRDIKHDNILLRENSLFDPVLVDFGLSFNRDGDDQHKTHMSEELGNRFLRLPELSVSSPMKRDNRSDITFCVGILLYMLTTEDPSLLINEKRQMPHQRDEIRRALEKRVNPQPLSNLLRIFDRGFQIELSHRWQTPSELRDELQHLLNPEEAGEVTSQIIWKHVEQYMNQPKAQIEADISKKLNDGLTKIRLIQSKILQRVEGHFSQSQTGQHIKPEEGFAETLLAFTKVAQSTTISWITFRLDVVGNEIIFTSREQGNPHTFYRTGLDAPVYDIAFESAVERIFLDHIQGQIN